MAQIIRLSKGVNFNQGYIELYGRTGNCYTTLALEIPGFGLVPCSMKLRDDFTTLSDDLYVIKSDANDPNAPYTSHIWVTRKKRKTA